MKTKRQEKILEIIEKKDIETQDDLISALKSEGILATQATASRDIRELKLLKVMVGGVYKYVAPRNESKEVFEYGNAILTSIREINVALNLVVVKTTPGLAQAVAAAIDTIKDSEILGCVAGDDTIFVATHSPESAQKVASKIGKTAQ